MPSDHDVISNGKRAIWLALTLTGVLMIGGILAYPVAWIYSSHRTHKLEVGNAEFFGKVVDLEGRPLEGVRLKSGLLKYSFFGGLREESSQIMTDDNGAFSIGPTEAIKLGLSEFEKIGYRVQGRRWPKKGWKYWVFRYSPNSNERFVSSESIPFIFTMEPQA